MDIKFMTPTEVWESFNPNEDGLENSIISQEINDNLVCSKQYFTSEVIQDGPLRAYIEIYYDKRWTDSRPVLMLLPPLYKYNFRDITQDLVNEGFVVAIVDYCGNIVGDNKTSFPSSYSFAKWPDCSNYLSTLDGDAKHTVYYIWAKIVRRAITLLEQIKVADEKKICLIGSGNGSQLAWIVTGIDKRISALVAINGGGYIWTNNESRRTTGNVPQNDLDSAFSSGIGAETYAKLITCPVLLIASSNSTYYDIDRTNDILANVKSDNKTFIVSQASDTQISYTSYNAMRDWLRNVFVFSTDMPYHPTVEFQKIEEKLYIHIYTNHKTIVKSIYVNYGEPYTYAKIWKELTDLQKVNTHEYTCVVPVYDEKVTITAYATLQYNPEHLESTPIVEIIPEKLSIKADAIDKNSTNRIFYDNSMGIGSFTAVTHATILDDDAVKLIEGPFGIKGVSSENGSLYLRHNANEITTISKSSLFHFDVYSPTSRELELVMYSYPKKKGYYAKIKLNGGNYWQNILLDSSDFKSTEGKPLLDFNTTKLFRIKDVSGLIFNNFLWV